MDRRARTLADRVTGNFKGTTDEIIQWAACKWGFSDETVRAQAVNESTWYQSTGGDVTSNQAACQAGYTAPCPESFGLLQIKANTWRGTFPSSRDATAFNVDYTLMVRRACYEGWVNWMYHYPGSSAIYRAGDEWGCIGFWYSGTWYGTGTQSYIDGVKQNFNAKPWRNWADRSTYTTPTAGSVKLTGPTSATAGKAITVNWSAPAGTTTARDWIAIYSSGSPNTGYREWHYTGGATSGTMSFTAPTTAGTYEFRYLLNDGYTSVATSNPLTVGSATATTTTAVAPTTTTSAPTTTTTTVAPTATFTLKAPSTAVRGARVTVSWTAPAGKTSARDWIAVYSPTAANTSYGEWHYTGGATTGTMSFTAPNTAGTYEFRYLLNDGYTSVARSAAMTVS